jgi:hypothetical protein
MKLRPGQSILVRVVAALAFVGVVPLLVAAVGLIDVNTDGMITQVLRTHAVAARTAADRVETFIGSWESRCRATASNELIQTDPRSLESQEILQSLLQGSPELAVIEIFDADGRSVLRAARRDLSDKVGSWIGRVMKGRIDLVRESGSPWILVSSNLPAPLGSIQMIVDAAVVDQVLNAPEVGEQADLALIGPGPQILAPQRVDFGMFPPALIERGSKASIVGSGEFTDPSGNEVLGAFAPIPDHQWFIVSKQPIDVAYEVQKRMRARSATALGLALGLTLVLSGVAYQQMIRPIRQLVSAQRKLAGQKEGGEGSEIKQLQETFELIERRIKDQEEMGRVFVGRYQVLGLIGRGGMGMVFRGWDPKLQRNVALKAVRVKEGKSAAEKEDLVEALRNEAVTIAKFSHPNIVAVYDVESAGDAAFIAMEIVEGMGLDKYLARRKRVDWMEATVIGFAIARALAAAHEAGFLHQDIKPPNVLLGRDGSIKVTDFGIAQPLSAGPARTDVVFGTPGYLSPEGCKGVRMGPEGDLFALGVVLWEIMVGVNPFRKGNVLATMRATVDELVPAPRSRVGTIDLELSNLVAELIEKDPSLRLKDSAEVVRRLGDILRRSGAKWSYPEDIAELDARRKAQNA